MIEEAQRDHPGDVTIPKWQQNIAEVLSKLELVDEDDAPGDDTDKTSKHARFARFNFRRACSSTLRSSAPPSLRTVYHDLLAVSAFRCTLLT